MLAVSRRIHHRIDKSLPLAAPPLHWPCIGDGEIAATLAHLSFATASFISLRCVSALGVSVTCAILPYRPMRKLTRFAMLRSIIRTP
jgi:hypothetical protein